MSELRLFGLKCNGKPIKGLFFHKKPDAKAERDRLNEQESGKYEVTPGPDHWKSHQ